MQHVCADGTAAGSRPRYGTQQSSSSAFFQGDSGQATADAWSSSGTFDRQPSSSPMFSAPQYGNYQPQNGYMSYQQPSNTQGPTYNAGSPPTAQSQGTNQPIQPQGTTTGGTVDNSGKQMPSSTCVPSCCGKRVVTVAAHPQQLNRAMQHSELACPHGIACTMP